MDFIKTDITELKESFTKMIRDDWALLTAGEQGSFNTMTVSWGGAGELWKKDVAFVFVRPQRYTYEFLQEHDIFTLSFFDSSYKQKLTICGRQSGRDIDKVSQCGFNPISLDGGVCFDEAKTVIVCKKLAFQDIDSKGFISDEIANNYSNNDYHRVFIGEIIGVYEKKQKN